METVTAINASETQVVDCVGSECKPQQEMSGFTLSVILAVLLFLAFRAFNE